TASRCTASATGCGWRRRSKARRGCRFCWRSRNSARRRQEHIRSAGLKLLLHCSEIERLGALQPAAEREDCIAELACQQLVDVGRAGPVELRRAHAMFEDNGGPMRGEG